MNLDFTSEEQIFRRQVRDFLDGCLPRDLSDKVLRGKRLGKNDFMRWQKILHEQGWGEIQKNIISQPILGL